MGQTAQRRAWPSWPGDLAAAVAAGALVSLGLHYFANANGFYPGGLSGLAFLLSDWLHLERSLLLLLFNLPLFVALAALVNRKLGIYLSVYMLVQSAGFALLESWHFPVYVAAGELVLAAVGAGVVSGTGYALMMRHFGASGGTYAISALIKQLRPGANAAWLSFAMDALVVVAVVLLHGFRAEPVLCTLINLFLADAVVDQGVKGIKSAYRFEIITDQAQELAQRIMACSRHGVTLLQGEGMYTHQGRQVLVCIVRKRHASEIIRLLREYPAAFTSIAKVNEVFGRFHK